MAVTVRGPLSQGGLSILRCKHWVPGMTRKKSDRSSEFSTTWSESLALSPSPQTYQEDPSAAHCCPRPLQRGMDEVEARSTGRERTRLWALPAGQSLGPPSRPSRRDTQSQLQALSLGPWGSTLSPPSTFSQALDTQSSPFGP